MFGASLSAMAGDADLDPSFANGFGVMFPNFHYVPDNSFADQARDVAVGSDQRITVVGDFRTSAGSEARDCGVLRTLSDASGYDTSFAAVGYRSIGLEFGGDGNDECRAVLLLPDGRSVIAGTSSVSALQTAGTLIMLGADGELDASFHSDGVFDTATWFGGTSAIGTANVAFNELILDSAGRIVVVGGYTVDGGGGGVMMRFSANGATFNPDLSFSGLGVATMPAPGGQTQTLNDIVELDDQTYLASGNGPNGGVLFQRDGNGQFTSAFGGFNGMSFIRCNTFDAMARDSQQRILLACPPLGLLPTSILAGVLRLLPDGSVDTSFGVDGLASIRATPADDFPLANGGHIEAITAILPHADGRVFVSGQYRNRFEDTGVHGPYDLVVARLLDDGSSDTGFGSDGARLYRFGVNDELVERGLAAALDAFERPIIVGLRAQPPTSAPGAYEYILMRLQKLGDTIFIGDFEQ